MTVREFHGVIAGLKAQAYADARNAGKQEMRGLDDGASRL
jgi:hypothetical protein